jgi:hypothetical protein
VTRKVHRNFTVEGQRIGLKANLETIALTTLLFVIVASFLAGYLLGEDSTGWACFDFYHYHWPLVKLFSETSWGAAVADYGGIPAANNPLLYIMASLIPLNGDQATYHVIALVTAFFAWPLLSWAYYRRYSRQGIGWLWASFGASTILISPTFRSSAFWGTTDWLPFVFCAGTSLLLSRFQDYAETDKDSATSPFTLAALAAVSACTFYTRQFYLFVPVLAVWVVLRNTKTSPLLVLILFAVATLPEMVFVYLWKGLNPPAFQEQTTRELAAAPFHTPLANFWMVGTMTGLFSLPIIVGCIRRAPSDVLPEWWGSRSTVAVAAGLSIFVMALSATEWPAEGGGIIVKAGLWMGAPGTFFILIAAYFGFVAVILFSMRSLTNAILAVTFLAPFFISAGFLGRPAGQRYLEPSLAVALFLFADTRTARRVFNKRVLICNFAFNALILAISVIHFYAFSMQICPR